MSDKTKIQWCDTTVNPIMGCGGCELFPSPGIVLEAIDQAVADTGARIDSRATYKELIHEAYAKISNPQPGHKNAVNTTNIWHLRRLFLEQLKRDHSKEAEFKRLHKNDETGARQLKLAQKSRRSKGNDIFQALSRYMLSINSLKEIREISELNVIAQFGQYSGSKIFF